MTYLKSVLIKSKRMRRPVGKGSKGGPKEMLFLKNPDVVKVARSFWAYQRPTEQILSMTGCMTYPLCSDKWPTPLTSWALRCMRYRRPGLARKSSGPPTEPPRPPQRTFTFLELSCPQSHWKSQASRGSIPPRPCENEVACPSAPGVARRGRMKRWW